MSRLLLVAVLVVAPAAMAQPPPSDHSATPGLAPDGDLPDRDLSDDIRVQPRADSTLAVLIDQFAYDDQIDASTFAAQVTEWFHADSSATRPMQTSLPRPTGWELQRAVVAFHMAMPGVLLLPYGDMAGTWGADSEPMGYSPPPDFDPDLVVFYRSARALRRHDPVLRRGDLSVAVASGRAVAFELTLGAERRLVAFNAGDEPAFLELPGPGVPQPWTPFFVSRDDTGRVPSLVALFDDDRAVYGLRVPAQTTVVYLPAGPADVRPRGLDE